jgi:arylsulfatase A-like enzyme
MAVGAVGVLVVTAVTVAIIEIETDPLPNVVMIVADDLDKALFDRMYGEGLLPAIRDNIGNPGTTFTNAFVTEALCCPARATYLTGQYAHNHFVFDNLKPFGGITRFTDSNALPVWLKGTSNKYINGLVGKYLNGYGEGTSGTEGPTYIPPGWHFWRGLRDYVMYSYRVVQWDSTSGVTNVVTYGTGAANYQTDKFASMASNFIGSLDATLDATPFFLYVAPFAPHQIHSDAPGIPRTTCGNQYWKYLAQPAVRHDGTLSSYATSMPQGTGYNEADVSDKPDFVRNTPLLSGAEVECAKIQYQKRAEAMLAIDDLVATIVAKLGTSGETANTVLVFTSDNGYALGNHRLCCKIPGYEEDIRMPLLMSGPGIPAGATRDKLALNNDLAPTFAAWAQVTPSLAVDGVSLVPLLANPAVSPWRTRFLVEYQGTQLIPTFYGVRTHSSDAVSDALFVNWQDASASVEYYELATDPEQATSRHADPTTAIQRATMQTYLNNLKQCGQAGQPTCAAVE